MKRSKTFDLEKAGAAQRDAVHRGQQEPFRHSGDPQSRYLAVSQRKIGQLVTEFRLISRR
ncbi:hypothetical protein M8494_27435 [Serratia ureilytica]